MKKFKICMTVCFLATFCCLFTACSFSYIDSGDGSSDYQTFAYMLNDVQVVSIGEGEETGQYCFDMVERLSNLLYDGLLNEYGENNLTSGIGTPISRSDEDTHIEAILQDNWSWDLLTANKSEVLGLLQYQIYMVMLGLETLELTPKDFSSNEYLELKNAGAFQKENLKVLANELSHIGFFYYELDNIAEFVLNKVIGKDIVERDNLKFKDVNENGTFDYVEDYVLTLIDKTHNIISSYNFSKDRDERVERNGVWSRIEWGNALVKPEIIDDDLILNPELQPEDTIKASEIVLEKALPLTSSTEISVESKAIDYVNSLILTQPEREAELKKFKQQNDLTLFSGFKNYVNTVYYILYSSMKNFTFFYNDDLTEPIVIEDVLEMEHYPNITNRVLDPFDLIYNEENQDFNLPFDQYKSVLLTTKTLSATSSFYVIMKSNMPNAELEVDINVRYHFTSDNYRNFIGPYEGERMVQAKMMTMKLPYGEETGYYALLTITPENFDDLVKKGVSLTEEDITPLAKMGVYNIVLDRYYPYVYQDGFTPTRFNYKEGYVAEPSTTFQGSSFRYQNEMTDYLEIIFDVKGSYETTPEFTFAINWL